LGLKNLENLLHHERNVGKSYFMGFPPCKGSRHSSSSHVNGGIKIIDFLTTHAM
jgi:hypothetical protein